MVSSNLLCRAIYYGLRYDVRRQPEHSKKKYVRQGYGHIHLLNARGVLKQLQDNHERNFQHKLHVVYWLYFSFLGFVFCLYRNFVNDQAIKVRKR